MAGFRLKTGKRKSNVSRRLIRAIMSQLYGTSITSPDKSQTTNKGKAKKASNKKKKAHKALRA
jgi:hypothetical protein